MARSRRSSATPPIWPKKLIRDVAAALVGGYGSMLLIGIDRIKDANSCL
jgi:hypothetical protein